jgi:hypothetical protein
MFLQNKFFLGQFEFSDGISVERSYLAHKPTHRIYYSSVQSKAPIMANIIIIHGWMTNVGYMEDAVNFARNGIMCHVFH